MAEFSRICPGVPPRSEAPGVPPFARRQREVSNAHPETEILHLVRRGRRRVHLRTPCGLVSDAHRRWGVQILRPCRRSGHSQFSRLRALTGAEMDYRYIQITAAGRSYRLDLPAKELYREREERIPLRGKEWDVLRFLIDQSVESPRMLITREQLETHG